MIRGRAQSIRTVDSRQPHAHNGPAPGPRAGCGHVLVFSLISASTKRTSSRAVRCRAQRVPCRTSPTTFDITLGSRRSKRTGVRAGQGEPRRRREEHEVAGLESADGGRRRPNDRCPAEPHRSSAHRRPSSGLPSCRRRTFSRHRSESPETGRAVTLPVLPAGRSGCRRARRRDRGSWRTQR